MPYISIIAPIFKAEKYLCRCIDSILAQTEKEFEIILVDDGSPDKSGEICDSYAKKDSRIVVVHKKNEGVSATRQSGLDIAKGDYVIYADPDDWIEPNMIEDLYSIITSEEKDMIICDYYVNANGQQYYEKQQPSNMTNDSLLIDLHKGYLHGGTWNKLIRKECFKRYMVTFPKGISFCEDLYTITALLLNPLKIGYCPKAYYHYDQNINANAITRTYTISDLATDKLLYEKFARLLANYERKTYILDHIACLIIGRAYNAEVFSSYSFLKEFFKYRRSTIRYSLPKSYKILYYLSCIGFYNCSKKLRAGYNSIRRVYAK